MTAEEKLEKFIERLRKLSDYEVRIGEELRLLFSSVHGYHAFTVLEVRRDRNAVESVKFADHSVLNPDKEKLRKAFSELEKEKNTKRVVVVTLPELVKKLAEIEDESS